MGIVIQSLGIAFVVIAICFLLKPHILKRIFEFFRRGRRLYLAGLTRFALAIVFLLGARECERFWIIFAFGILFIISGLLIFVIPLEKLKAIIDWYQKQSLLLLRVLAVITLAIGAVIIYAA